MLTRIYADNFLCLGNFEFRPKRLNLLLGENGSGKTSLFEVLRLIRELVVGGSSVASLFSGTGTIWDRRDIQSFELDLDSHTHKGTFSYRLEIKRIPKPLPELPYIGGECLDFDGKPLYRYRAGQVQLFDDEHEPGPSFPFKAARSFLPNLEEQNPKLQWFKTFIAGIHVFQLNPFALDPYSQQDERHLTFNASNFVSWLRYLSEEKPEAKLECEERLAEIIPGFQRFRFQSVGDQKELYASFSREGRDDYELALLSLSEGQRILSILYSVLYGLVGKASVLCFDEPENFISLPEVQPWLQGLRDLVEERSGQALVISHHPEVIDYLAADSAFLFERPAGDLVRVRPWTPDPSKIMKPSEVLVRGGLD
jgi:predicted ATPase